MLLFNILSLNLINPLLSNPITVYVAPVSIFVVIFTGLVFKTNFISVKYDSEPIYVEADEFYAEQVFTNYFTNATKNILEIIQAKPFCGS